MTQNAFFLLIKYILIDLIGDFIYFPLWWYSGGLKKALLFTGDKIMGAERVLGVSLWAKNLFVPMYGQYDWQGRLVSFFMRLFQLIFRSIIFVVCFIFMLFIPIIWVVFPIFIIFQIFLAFSNITK